MVKEANSMIDITQDVLRMIARTVRDHRGHALLVGGAVRDGILGLPIKDYDVEVYGLSPEAIVDLFKTYGKIDMVGASFGVIKLDIEGCSPIDISVPRRDSRIGDASGRGRGFIAVPDPSMTTTEASARRDFTMNSMARDIFTGELIDPFGGAYDIKSRILKHTSDHFVEDSLRVLRAMQFAARFQMNIAHETASLCAGMVREAQHLAVERVWEEWRKWATKGVQPSLGIETLIVTTWIQLYPELNALRTLDQEPSWHPEGTVLRHTKFVCDHAAFVARRDALNENDTLVLVLAALLHDIGKRMTTTTNELGQIVSPGHAQAGVEPARFFLTQIGAHQDIIDQVLPLVSCHMDHIGVLFNARFARRLARRLAPSTILQWERLIECDASGRPPMPHSRPARDILFHAFQEHVLHNPPSAIVMGRHLLELGWKPGPAVGAALKAAYEAQVEGLFVTLQGGIQWIQEHIPNEAPHDQ